MSELRALLGVADEPIALVGADGALLAGSESFAAGLGAAGGAQPARLDEALGLDAWLALLRALDDAAPPVPLAPAASARTVRLAVALPTSAGPRHVELRARRVAAGGAIAVALRAPDGAAAAWDAAPQSEPTAPLPRRALHEIANLLVSIQFASDALLAEDASPAEAREDLAAIRDAAERAGALLAGLRARAPAPTSEPTELGAAVPACAPLLASLRPPPASCSVTVFDAPLRVRVPRERLEALLAQLVIAAQGGAQEAGALELRVGLATRDDDAGVRGAPDAIPPRRAAITLRDAAADPAALRARLADDAELARPAVRALVAELGGELAIEAAPEGGALVTVYLPLVPDDEVG